MNNETLPELRLAIAKLSGKAMALEMLLQVLMEDHPHRAEIEARYRAMIEGLLDATLPIPLPEEARDQLAETRDHVLTRIRGR